MGLSTSCFMPQIFKPGGACWMIVVRPPPLSLRFCRVPDGTERWYQSNSFSRILTNDLWCNAATSNTFSNDIQSLFDPYILLILLCFSLQWIRCLQLDRSSVRPLITLLQFLPVDSESRSPPVETQSSLWKLYSRESRSWGQVMLTKHFSARCDLFFHTSCSLARVYICTISHAKTIDAYLSGDCHSDWPSDRMPLGFTSFLCLFLGGSFRHFMWLMARELQGNHVGLLVPCPSSAANKNKVRPLKYWQKLLKSAHEGLH